MSVWLMLLLAVMKKWQWASLTYKGTVLRLTHMESHLKIIWHGFFRTRAAQRTDIFLEKSE